METAMFVCLLFALARNPMADLTFQIVVVAWSDQLCLGMRCCEDLHCRGTAALDRLSSPHADPVGGNRRDINYRPGLLVHVDPPVPASLVLLAAGSAVDGSYGHRSRKLYGSRQHHCHRLCLQCHRYLL